MKHLGPNSLGLATASCIKTVSISDQWRNISFITSFAEYFSVQDYFVWKDFEWFQLICSMPKDDAKSISIKLVSHLDNILNLCLKPLRGNVCDIEVFDCVLSQYFSGLKSLDILVQPSLRVIIFKFLGVENTVSNFFSLMLPTFKFLYGIKQFHYPQLVKSRLTCNFSETGLFLTVIITISFKSFE